MRMLLGAVLGAVLLAAPAVAQTITDEGEPVTVVTTAECGVTAIQTPYKSLSPIWYDRRPGQDCGGEVTDPGDGGTDTGGVTPPDTVQPEFATVGILPPGAPPLNETAPEGASTVCPEGCDYKYVRAAFADLSSGDTIAIYGGEGPEPLIYRGAATRFNTYHLIGYGKVRPEIWSDAQAGDGFQLDGDAEGFIQLQRGGSIRDINLRGKPRDSKDAAGQVRVWSQHGTSGATEYDHCAGGGRDYVEERVGHLGSWMAVFGASAFKCSIYLRQIWVEGHGVQPKVHGVYASGPCLRVQVEFSYFASTVRPDSNQIRSNCRDTIVRMSKLGDPGDQSSKTIDLGYHYGRFSARHVELVGNEIVNGTSHASMIGASLKPPTAPEQPAAITLDKIVIAYNSITHQEDRSVLFRGYFPPDEMAGEWLVENNVMVGGRGSDGAYLYDPATGSDQFLPLPGDSIATTPGPAVAGSVAPPTHWPDGTERDGSLMGAVAP